MVITTSMEIFVEKYRQGRSQDFWNSTKKYQNFNTPYTEKNISRTLIQLHQDNVEDKLGHKIIYKTNNIWEESTIIRISKSRCSIGINSGKKKN